MTRVTNFGIKRTYLEAGFGKQDDTTSNSNLAQPSPLKEPSTISSNADDSRPAKKQKRKKDAKSKGKTQSTTVDGEEHVEASGSSPKVDGEEQKRPRKRHRSKKGKGPLGFSQVKEKDSATTKSGSNSKAQSVSTNSGWERKNNGTRRPLEDQARALARSRFDDPREERRVKRIDYKMQETTCFACREKGHAAKDCPKTSEIAMAEVSLEDEEDGGASTTKLGQAQKVAPVVGICYRCGSNKHNLSRCKKPADSDNPLPFASCFVCSGKGHLAGSCPKNQNKGVYPNGGCCKICGDTTHLAKECVVRQNDSVAVKSAVGTGTGAGADEDDFMVLKRRARQVEKEEGDEERWKKIANASDKTPNISRKASVPHKKKVVVF